MKHFRLVHDTAPFVLFPFYNPEVEDAEFTLAANVVSRIEVVPIPAFFVAGTRREPRQATLEVINHEASPLVIYKVEHPTERFTTQLETLQAGQRYRLMLLLKTDGPGGRHTDSILLRTSNTQTPTLRIEANTWLRERVYAFPDTVDMGTIRLADLAARPTLLDEAAQTLMVYQDGGKDFRIQVRSNVQSVLLQAERGSTADRYQITARLTADRLKPGPIAGEISIATNDPEFSQFSVPLIGNIVP